MPSTANFGWPTPEDTAQVANGPAIIRALGDAADATVFAQGTAITALTGRVDNLDLNDLSDVDTSGVADGELLGFDSGSGLWSPVAVAAGGLVAVKSAIFTGTMAETSVASGANFAVTDLSITHETADVANKLIISAFLGVAASTDTRGLVGLAVHDGTNLIAIGDAAGSRSRTTAGGFVAGTGSTVVVTMPSVSFVHTPGAGSKTYTVRAINLDSTTETIYINRSQDDSNSVDRQRGASSLVIQEVRV